LTNFDQRFELLGVCYTPSPPLTHTPPVATSLCTFLSVQVDETTDMSTKEQLSIIVRLDSGSDIVERFLKFVDVSTDIELLSL
jgi:hypothetical protein